MQSALRRNHNLDVSQTYLVETYCSGRTDMDIHAATTLVSNAAQAMRGTGQFVTLLGCLLVPDDEVCFWRFSASSQEAMDEVARVAGLDVQRTARSIDVHGPPFERTDDSAVHSQGDIR